MGGLATKQFGTQRITRVQYDTLVNALGESRFFEIQHGFKNKRDFGDMDILCVYNAEDTLRLVRSLLEKSGLPTHVSGSVSNGNCLSVAMTVGDFPNFQFDFITLTGIENRNNLFELEQAFHWHAMFLKSDFGALIGNVLRPYSLCYTHEGLFAEIEYRGNTYRECICKDVNKFLDFLGIKQRDTSVSFEDSEQLYNTVSQCVFVNSDYLGERVLNHKERHREKSRPIFANYRDWYEKSQVQKPAIENMAEFRDERLYRFFGFKMNTFINEVTEKVNNRIAVRNHLLKHLGNIADGKERAFKDARGNYKESELLEDSLLPESKIFKVQERYGNTYVTFLVNNGKVWYLLENEPKTP